MPATTARVNALTIDVEEYFHPNAMDAAVSPDQWDNLPHRVERNTQHVLDILGEFDIHATFFVLGWVAERWPSLVREISGRGHEVASHGFAHRLVYKLGPEKFRSDVVRGKKALEDCLGQRVRGFRAASWSIIRSTLWALDILIEEGFEYDSSIFPVRHDIYGIPGFSRFPVRVCCDAGEILEIPPSTVRLWGNNWPVAGGGYLRIFPYALNRWAIARINRVDGAPAMVYIHPWELDVDQPRLAAKTSARLRQYANLRSTETRLRRLMADFRFAPLSEAMAAMCATAETVDISTSAGTVFPRSHVWREQSHDTFGVTNVRGGPVKVGGGQTACRHRTALAAIFGAIATLVAPSSAPAYVTLTPNLGLSEGYNDNIYLTPDKTWDFIAPHIGMGVQYDTQYSSVNLNLGISVAYLAHANTTDIILGEGQGSTLSTSYQLTPDVLINVYDNFGRVGTARDFVTGTGTYLPPPQQETDPANNNPGNVSLLLPGGSAFVNSFGITVTYSLDPRWSTNLTYSNGIANFADIDNLTLTQRGGVTLGYQWSPTFSIGPSFQYSRFNSMNAPDSEAYTGTMGGSYQISEYLTAYGSLGASLTRQLEGPADTSASGTFTIGLNCLFERSFLTVGAQQGVTPSAGIAGASTTLGGYLSYGIHLTQYLSGALNTTYTHFDTTTTTFDVVYLNAGLSYPVWRNISAGLAYSYIRTDSNAALEDVLAAGVVDQNSVRIGLNWAEPWWQFQPW